MQRILLWLHDTSETQRLHRRTSVRDNINTASVQSFLDKFDAMMGE